MTYEIGNFYRDGDVVTCPGHGLRWNVKTGELVTARKGEQT